MMYPRFDLQTENEEINHFYNSCFHNRSEPVGTADIGAELHRLSARSLGQLLSAVAAAVRVRKFFYMHSGLGAGELVSAAEG